MSNAKLRITITSPQRTPIVFGFTRMHCAQSLTPPEKRQQAPDVPEGEKRRNSRPQRHGSVIPNCPAKERADASFTHNRRKENGEASFTQNRRKECGDASFNQNRRKEDGDASFNQEWSASEVSKQLTSASAIHTAVKENEQLQSANGNGRTSRTPSMSTSSSRLVHLQHTTLAWALFDLCAMSDAWRV